LGRRKESAAGTLENLAMALRKAASEPGADGQDATAVVAWAADGLERASSSLREKDLGSMLRDAENFGRAQPVAFFFAAAAAGFLAARFVKAGTGQKHDTSFEDPVAGL
jgi:hypothetical protein